MKEYLVCEIAYSYGVYLHKARRFTEEEKEGLAEWFKNEGFVGIGKSTKLEHISWTDLGKILKDRKLDGSFSGCSNSAYIISEEEWNTLLELDEQKRAEKEKKKTEKLIAEYRQTVEQCERQEKLYTREEAAEKYRNYNRLFNEGGEGYVPHFYTVEEYEFAKARLSELLKE